MPVLRLVGSNLRRRAIRSVALIAGLALATTSFIVLLGSSTTSRTTATATVDETARAPYHIVVRPPKTRVPLEERDGLVRPNYLSGLFGGITLDQWRTIQGLSDVEVAAPIANLGAAGGFGLAQIDVTDAVDPDRTTQLIRLRPQWRTDRGLSTSEDVPGFLYVTRNPVVWPKTDTWVNPTATYSDGVERTSSCGIDTWTMAYEVRPEGEVAICSFGAFPTSDRVRPFTDMVARLLPDGQFESQPMAHLFADRRVHTTDRLVAPMRFPFTIQVAAVDPEQEARLIGLDRAVTSGRYLPAFWPGSALPTLVADRTYLDEQVVVTPESIDGALDPAALSWRVFDEAPAMAAAPPRTVDADEAHREALATTSLYAVYSEVYFAGPIRYGALSDGTLTPQKTGTSAIASLSNRWLERSWLLDDDSFRSVTGGEAWDGEGSLIMLQQVGIFDPSLINQVSAFARVPMETYQPPDVSAADPSSAAALGGEPLLPNSNVGGYLTTPPMAITTLGAIDDIAEGLPNADAPISAVRVRVAGVTAADTAAMARAAAVAQRIRAATGLIVDVTLGSSATPQTVALADGEFGRPDLMLREGWSRKGVASVVISAVNSRSALLLVLILVVCGLFLANAANSAVRARRRELAVLHCLGWSGRRLLGLVLGEMALAGAIAGVASAALAIPVGLLAGLRIPLLLALAAIPVSIVVAVLAGVLPAVRAARTHPGPDLHVPARGPRLGRGRHRTVVGLALSQVVRAPGREIAGVVALTIGISALTVLVSINGIFQQALTGTASLLGETVLTRVAIVDQLAVLVIVLLGGVAVADLLFLNIRERGGEFAALQAVGWSAFATGRLVFWEGLTLGVLGSVLGAGIGLAIVGRQVDAVPQPVIQASVTAAAIGVIVSTAAAVAAAQLLRRAPTSALLAEE